MSERAASGPPVVTCLRAAGTCPRSCCFFLMKREEHMDTAKTRETAGLIGSDKVEGTNVYGASDEKIGSIERVMISKMEGKVAYAVLSFGGFLGMGDEH